MGGNTMATLNDQVIGALYGAIDDPGRWIGLMDLLRQHMGVESVAAQLLVPSQDLLLPLWTRRDSHSERNGMLHDSWANSPANPRFRRPLSPPPALDIDSDQRCRDYSAQDRRMLSDGLARCGLGPAFWLSQRLDDGHTFTLIFHRVADDRRDMGAHDESLLTLLAPHIRQALRLQTRLTTLEMQAGLVQQANDAMMTAMVACDRQLRVHWSNADARAMFAAPDMLHLRDDHLSAPCRTDHERLLALVQGRYDRTVMAMGGIDRPALHIRARPAQTLPEHPALTRDLVLLVMTRPDLAVRYAPADLAMLFGLTMTEAALAASLAAGGSVSDFAVARGIAEGTARLHLKRVLAKTGTGRQSELVRRICRSVADGQIVL
ncbi:helix-turn-helix transcriptional regulator [Novosphingobium terrae]|uniref:helix-turn-helix transcriptional regulator n=1 Tax=Novosphingobium terrae TaxID=2726189 RepID=UPI00197D095E|nr:LuxR family transcriptional regulator [Novosphingobium terrae]